MLTGSADFAVGLIWVGLPCWEVLSVNMFTFFFLDQFPQRSLFLSSAWQVRLPGFWELSA